MLIENESNWNTEDLIALTESVAGILGKDARSSAWKEDTLILFQTSRRREKKTWRRPNGEAVPPPVAFYDCRTSQRRYVNTIVIFIASALRLKLEVLDRLAHVNDRQEMSSENVVRIAAAIAGALGNWRINKMDFSWAAHSPMRTRAKTTRSKLATSREIEKLRRDQETIQKEANYEINQIEMRIEHLRKSLR